jgi:CHAT domain
MASDRSALRLAVLGQLLEEKQPQTLITLADFKHYRAVQRVELVKEKLDELVEKMLELRDFIEGGPPKISRLWLQEFGTKLFDLTIQGDVRRLFDKATALLLQKEGRLPLEIFLEDFGIANWPWEYLYDSGSHLFICQAFHPISRGIFNFDLISEPYFNKNRVRILIVVAIPPNDSIMTPLDEIKSIKNVFKYALKKQRVATDSFKLNVFLAARPLDLEQKLEIDEPYDIVHFWGHGGFDSTLKQGYLKFERLKDSNENSSRLYASDFAQLIYDYKIRLVFLNGCETARTDQNDDPSRSSVAGALLKVGVPAVVANQYSMPDNSSHSLSATFYNELVKGQTVAEAMRRGRRRMEYTEKSKLLDWGIPVLYSSDPNLIVFSSQMKPPVSIGPEEIIPKPPTEGVQKLADHGIR